MDNGNEPKTTFSLYKVSPSSLSLTLYSIIATSFHINQATIYGCIQTKLNLILRISNNYFHFHKEVNERTRVES